MPGTCKYCNSTSYNNGYPRSQDKKHEHIDDKKHCVFCGSTSTGSGCPHSPTKKHEK
jgi:hypothetical protein